jgi:hypothetical protein
MVLDFPGPGFLRMTELQTELETKAKRLKWKGKRNYLFAYSLYAAAGMSSGIATIWTAALAASKTSPNIWTALVTAIPALAVILNETLKPEQKGRWCYEKRAVLEALLRDSRYGARPDGAIVVEWNALEIKMEQQWPRFGSAGSKLIKNPNRRK